MKTHYIAFIAFGMLVCGILLGMVGMLISTDSQEKTQTHWFGEMVVGYKNDNGEFITTLDGARVGVRSDGALVTDFEKE